MDEPKDTENKFLSLLKSNQAIIPLAVFFLLLFIFYFTSSPFERCVRQEHSDSEFTSAVYLFRDCMRKTHW